jgi:HlyD family secretion protein
VLDIEKQARTVEIEVEIDDPQGNNLLPGYSADVEVILATRENVLRVPTQVVIDRSWVYVLEDGVLHERAIEIGVANWDYSEIVSGLSEDEVVVLSVDREGVEDGAMAVQN